ncbi:hypothetical protein PMAYCL1PPCAC_08440, partial [Pristionchus mayeri]
TSCPETEIIGGSNVQITRYIQCALRNIDIYTTVKAVVTFNDMSISRDYELILNVQRDINQTVKRSIKGNQPQSFEVEGYSSSVEFVWQPMGNNDYFFAQADCNGVAITIDRSSTSTSFQSFGGILMLTVLVTLVLRFLIKRKSSNTFTNIPHDLPMPSK